MSDDTRDGLDARIDRVLREQTAPRPDPAFRARVLARLDEPASAWAPWVSRLAMPAAALAVCVVLALFVRIAPEPRVVRSTQPAVTTTAPAPTRNATVQPQRTASAEATNSGDAGVDPSAGPRSGVTSDGTSAAGDTHARRDSSRVEAAGTARALSAPPESTVSPSLAPVAVGEVAVDPIEVRPLASTTRFAALAGPEPVDVEPIRVGPIGGR